MNEQLPAANHELLTMNLKNLLYHNRTLAVTEAYALICNFGFNILKNNDLICGMCFCKQ